MDKEKPVKKVADSNKIEKWLLRMQGLYTNLSCSEAKHDVLGLLAIIRAYREVNHLVWNHDFPKEWTLNDCWDHLVDKAMSAEQDVEELITP